MNDAGHVSVVIPVFNAGPLLGDALGSVLAQAGAVGEVIVVDDGSTDDIARVIAPFRSRIRHIAQPNRGPAAARNAGLGLARERYVAFLDADDVWPDGAISAALEHALQQPALDGVHGLTQLWVSRPAAIEHGGASPWARAGEPWRSPQLGSVLVKRALFERVGVFDAGLRQGEDLDWFVRLRHAAVQLQPIEHVMVHYRIHGRNASFGRGPGGRNTFLVLQRALERRRSAP